VLFTIVVHDGHRRVNEGPEPFADAVNVVIHPAAGLAPLEQALFHLRLWALKEEHKLGLAHVLLKLLALVHHAREAINQEAVVTLALLGGHRVLQQCDGDVHRHDLALLDVVVDQLSILRARVVSLVPQQVTSGQVHKPKLAHKFGALGALSSTRSPQNEHNSRVLLGEPWLGRGSLNLAI